MIKVSGVQKNFGSGLSLVKAVAGIDLHIEKGEYLAIIGPSGSGKSSLMNILGCLDKPTEGSYVLDGVDVSEMTETQLSTVRNQKIGFVFQSFNLLPKLDAVQNVALPLLYGGKKQKERRQLAIVALEKVGLGDRIKHKPNELSGGQKQRIAIARALVTHPAILLADEPTGNLDSHSTVEILELFDKLNKEGATIIIVTHEDEVAAHAKRVITVKDGKIFEDRRNGHAFL